MLLGHGSIKSILGKNYHNLESSLYEISTCYQLKSCNLYCIPATESVGHCDYLSNLDNTLEHDNILLLSGFTWI